MALTQGVLGPRRLVFLAGGGTVGHLAPGFAVRDALRELGHEGVFVTPGEAREHGWFPPNDPEPLHVPAPRLPTGLGSKLTFPFRMALAIARAWRLLRQEAPVAVLGLGGWPSAPTCIAATLCGVPLHLLMTDAVPGLVVRKLARRASRIHVANAAAASALAMPEKTSIVGPIVRREVVQARRDPARFGLVEGRRTLFVTGGSLGAKGLNDRVREGLRTAISADPDLARTVQVIHSTGTEEEAASSLAAFATLGLRHFVAPFIPDVGTALRTADLVLCRGGAGTLAEVEALHRPAVVVPYPHHADRQQWKNTERLLTSGLATLVEESALDTDAFANFVLGRLLADSEPPGSRDFGAAAVPKSQDGDSSVAAATIASDLVRSNGMV